MISKEEFKRLIENVVAKTGKTQEEIAVDMGYGKNYISEMTGPTGKISKKFVESLNLRYRDLSENPKTDFHVKSITNEMQNKSIDADLSIQALKNLTESGIKLANAQEIMANNESRLIALLEKKSTAGYQKDNDVASAPVMSGLLLAMAKIASGTRWHSEDEALRALGRIVDEQVVGSKKDENIHVDGGKQHIG